MIKIEIHDIGGGKTRRMYENKVPVGAGRRGDNTNKDLASNQLVQFFLRDFYRKFPHLLPPGPANSTGFLLDGKVGSQTIEGINRFQLAAQKTGIPVLRDSRVSVADGVNVPGTGLRWTIHLLNSFFLQSAGQKAFDQLFANKEIHAEAPTLAAQLVFEEQRLATGG